MKYKNIRSSIFVLLIFLASNLFLNSCDDSFLETKTPDYTEMSDTLFVTNATPPFSINTDFNKSTACNWRLAQYPLWLDVNPKEGKKEANTSSTLNFAVKDGDITVGLGFYTFPLIFDINEEELIGYTVILANLGHPSIEVSTRNISFTNDLNSSVELNNTSYGILNWEITDAPSWVKWNKAGGLLEQYQSELIEFTADVNGMDPGEYHGTIKIRSNAENYQEYGIQVTLQVTANAYYGTYHEGQLIESRYNKNNDEVIVLTKTPNQLLFFSGDVNTPEVVQLDRVPQCLALSEDESTIAIGYSNSEISLYNTENHTLVNTFQVGGIPISVEFGDLNQLYFIAEHSYWNYLNSLNLNTGVENRAKNGKSGIKTLTKIPGKNILASTRPGYSPDGLILFDISQAGQTDSINSYHIDLNGFWLSDNGNRLFSGWKKIYQFPEFYNGQSFFTDPPAIVGQLDFESSQIVDCIAQQSSSEKIFVATGFGWSGLNTIIKIYNDHTLVEQKTIELKFERAKNFSEYITWYGKPKAMYPSKNEKDLWLVQKYIEYDTDFPGIWSVTKVDISK